MLVEYSNVDDVRILEVCNYVICLRNVYGIQFRGGSLAGEMRESVEDSFALKEGKFAKATFASWPK